jgi:hypothetical protein
MVAYCKFGGLDAYSKFAPYAYLLCPLYTCLLVHLCASHWVVQESPLLPTKLIHRPSQITVASRAHISHTSSWICAYKLSVAHVFGAGPTDCLQVSPRVYLLTRWLLISSHFPPAFPLHRLPKPLNIRMSPSPVSGLLTLHSLHNLLCTGSHASSMICLEFWTLLQGSYVRPNEASS